MKRNIQFYHLSRQLKIIYHWVYNQEDPSELTERSFSSKQSKIKSSYSSDTLKNMDRWFKILDSVLRLYLNYTCRKKFGKKMISQIRRGCYWLFLIEIRLHHN